MEVRTQGPLPSMEVFRKMPQDRAMYSTKENMERLVRLPCIRSFMAEKFQEAGFGQDFGASSYPETSIANNGKNFQIRGGHETNAGNFPLNKRASFSNLNFGDDFVDASIYQSNQSSAQTPQGTYKEHMFLSGYPCETNNLVSSNTFNEVCNAAPYMQGRSLHKEGYSEGDSSSSLDLTVNSSPSGSDDSPKPSDDSGTQEGIYPGMMPGQTQASPTGGTFKAVSVDCNPSSPLWEYQAEHGKSRVRADQMAHNQAPLDVWPRQNGQGYTLVNGETNGYFPGMTGPNFNSIPVMGMAPENMTQGSAADLQAMTFDTMRANGQDFEELCPAQVINSNPVTPESFELPSEDSYPDLEMPETMNPRGKRKRGMNSQSYVALISHAILRSPEKKLLLSEIYQYISNHCASLKSSQEKAWRNSVRHSLSLNECFIKQERHGRGRGHFWTIHPACMEDFARGDFRRRQARRRAKKGCTGSFGAKERSHLDTSWSMSPMETAHHDDMARRGCVQSYAGQYAQIAMYGGSMGQSADGLDSQMGQAYSAIADVMGH